MKLIPLSQGKFALVDDEDFDWLNQWKWQVGTKSAVIRTDRSNDSHKTIRMHRLIMNAPSKKDVDHINGNPLDNRRSNLRLCSKLQNNFNRKLRADNATGFKGVSKKTWMSKGVEKIVWQAEVYADSKRYYLGCFKTKAAASKAYKQAALEIHGEFARLA